MNLGWEEIGDEEIGDEFRIYSAGQQLNWQEMPNLSNQNYFLKQNEFSSWKFNI